MIGMNRITGARLDGLEHIAQSIADILTTPVGSRVMRREYGSLLPEMIDRPINGRTKIELYAATAIALMRWEPRIRLGRVQLHLADHPGGAVLDIDGTRTDTQEQLNIRVPLQMGAST